SPYETAVARPSSLTTATNGATETQLPRTRTVWLVFDELDQQNGFSKRPTTIDLPEFDRFRSGAFFAENAYPPARNTKQSLPSLIPCRTVRMGGRSGLHEVLVCRSWPGVVSP